MNIGLETRTFNQIAWFLCLPSTVTKGAAVRQINWNKRNKSNWKNCYSAAISCIRNTTIKLLKVVERKDVGKSIRFMKCNAWNKPHNVYSMALDQNNELLSMKINRSKWNYVLLCSFNGAYSEMGASPTMAIVLQKNEAKNRFSPFTGHMTHLHTYSMNFFIWFSWATLFMVFVKLAKFRVHLDVCRCTDRLC